MDAPTGAARWFNRLDKEFETSPTSRVQTIDVASMSTASLYEYWITHTAPKHAVLMDTKRVLLKALAATAAHSEAMVVDCWGAIRWSRHAELDEESYAELKAAVTSTLYDVACPM